LILPTAGGGVRLNPRFDALNFFLADVRGGLGPYVGVYLLTHAHWTQAEIGAVLTVSGLLGISLQAPIGALIDATHAKRALIVGAVVLLAVSAVAIVLWPTLAVVLAADIVMAVLGAIFAPCVAAITLGCIRASDLAHRFGRNAVFDRIGNVFIAVLSGAIGWWLGQQAVFWLVPVFTMPAILAVLSIPARAIDHERARGLVHAQQDENPESWWVFFTGHRGFMALCVVALLFHLANASMMPLAAQMLALTHPGAEAPLVSALVLVAQVTAIGSGILVSTQTARFGAVNLLIGACAALVLRGCLFAFSDHVALVVAAQMLDGFGIGLFDTLLPLVLADLMHGTGRYNLARGILGTLQGIGGSLSNFISGFIVVQVSYAAAFGTLAAIGLAAMAMAALGLNGLWRRKIH
jgi:MFS family permease